MSPSWAIVSLRNVESLTTVKVSLRAGLSHPSPHAPLRHAESVVSRRRVPACYSQRRGHFGLLFGGLKRL